MLWDLVFHLRWCWIDLSHVEVDFRFLKKSSIFSFGRQKVNSLTLCAKISSDRQISGVLEPTSPPLFFEDQNFFIWDVFWKGVYFDVYVIFTSQWMYNIIVWLTANQSFCLKHAPQMKNMKLVMKKFNT